MNIHRSDLGPWGFKYASISCLVEKERVSLYIVEVCISLGECLLHGRILSRLFEMGHISPQSDFVLG